MKIFYSILLMNILLTPIIIFPQIENFTNIPVQYDEIKESFPIVIDENEVIVIYANLSQDSIFSVRTIDNGLTWNSAEFVQLIQLNISQDVVHLTGLKTISGRILLAWSVFREGLYIIYSDNNGLAWSHQYKLPGVSLFTSINLNLTQLSENNIILTSRDLVLSSNAKIVYRISQDNGTTWNEAVTVKYSSGDDILFANDLNYVPVNSNNIFGILSRTIQNTKRIYGLYTTQVNLEKPDTLTIFETSANISRLKLLRLNNGSLWIVYQLQDTTNIPYYKQYDIYFMISQDNGYSWSQPVRFTNYLGDDFYHNLSASEIFPLITFASKRFTNKNQLALGYVGYLIDSDYPPYIIKSWVEEINSENKTFNLRSRIIHDKKDFDVNVFYSDDFLLGKLYDDGLHNDGEEDDLIYGNDFMISELKPTDSYYLDINNIKLPVKNDGVIGNITPSLNLVFDIQIIYSGKILKNPVEFIAATGSFGGRYDDIQFLFSSGIILAGLDGNIPWANSTNSFSSLRDYQPGPVGAFENDFRNRIYIVRSDEPPFGKSWQDWRYAVELGADFYDGDGDGKYNPVDRNLNGTWDPSEDMPLIISDEIIWYVYNDGIPADQRRWQSDPKQIEIAQTLFASNNSGFENIIFLRYKIINKSPNVLDSVYFGLWADPDIGVYSLEDMVGCDTLLNSGFVYKYRSDPAYGINPPAFFTTVIQGPVVNSDYNTDTAFIKLGQQIGITAISAAANLGMTSHHRNFKSFYIDLREPDNVNTAYNYLKGLTRSGQLLDPCSFQYGEVLGEIDCNLINPLFVFSGDPVEKKG